MDYTPDGQLREENETLKQIIAAQDARILALKVQLTELPPARRNSGFERGKQKWQN